MGDRCPRCGNNTFSFLQNGVVYCTAPNCYYRSNSPDIYLSEEDFNQIINELENPPVYNEKLAKLLSKPSVFDYDDERYNLKIIAEEDVKAGQIMEVNPYTGKARVAR